jgi:hypothetical protein
MNILIGCECSGALRSRFRAAGHNAWSCDLKPAEDGSEHHVQIDVFHALTHPQQWCGADKWDLFICHPDCTALTVAGNHVYAVGKPKHHERLRAIQWTGQLWQVAKQYAHRVCFENPQGVLSTQSIMGPAAQYIQPYEFGDDASKKTGLWLHNLPPLTPTSRYPGRIVTHNGKQVERWSNQTDSGQNRLGPSEQRATIRARTYPGIADAIVNQWGSQE